MNNKIAFIIPYFGRWPEWMPLYLYSCSRQKGIDFLFFTDCERPGRTYPNTRFFPISFADYCQKVSSALAIGFRPSSPYKLCDLKPFYGLIHREELSGYDWWGFGDMDVVYGDLSLLVNARNLARYDMLTTHADKVAGHFTLVRKDSWVTSSALSIPDWREQLSLDEHVYFDETTWAETVKPWRIKKLNRLDFHLSRLLSPRHKALKERWLFFCYYWMERLTRLRRERVLMQEWFTTFHPDPDTVITYNPTNGHICLPSKQLWKIIGGGGKQKGSICTSSFSNKQDTGLSAPPTGAKATITSRPTTTSLKVAS